MNRLRQLWDDWVDEIELRLGKGSDALVNDLLERIRRLMLRQKFREAWEDTTYAVGQRKSMEGLIELAVIRIAEETAQHFARLAEIDAPEFRTGDLAMLKGLTRRKIGRFLSNVEEGLHRAFYTDAELQDALASRTATAQLVNQYIRKSQDIYAAGKKSYLLSWCKSIVGDGVHTGNRKAVESPDVTGVLRSEILDNRICANCARLDGLIFTKESARKIAPPVECLGRSLCRGVLIPILKWESPQPDMITPSQMPAMEQASGGRGRKIGDLSKGRSLFDSAVEI